MARRPPAKEKIPAWKSWDECLKYCQRKKDNFYSWAFLAESWLGLLIDATRAEYAENKSGNRNLQTGRGWETWRIIYEGIPLSQWGDLLAAYQRYSNCDTPDAEWIAGMWNLAGTEDKYGKVVFDSAALDREFAKGRETDESKEILLNAFKRLAEWLEALVHCRVHRLAAAVPLSIQTTPEQRELVDTGLTQAVFGQLNKHGRDWWNLRHTELTKQFGGHRDLRLIGKAQSLERSGEQKRSEVDDLAILFWPLLLRYQWTDRDLMGVLRRIVSRPDVYPLREDREFADYRKKALGLAKTGAERAKSAADGRPEGWKVAMALAGKPPGVSE